MKKNIIKSNKKNEQAKLIELIKEQSERINELRQENNDLLIALEAYRKKEKEISDLLSFAKKQSEELRSEAKIKLALECERIKLYRNKWLAVASSKDGISLAQNLEKTLSTLKDCQKEMEEMLASDLGESMQIYLKERDRIDDEPILDYKSILTDKKTPDAIDSLSGEEIEELLGQL